MAMLPMLPTRGVVPVPRRLPAGHTVRAVVAGTATPSDVGFVPSTSPLEGPPRRRSPLLLSAARSQHRFHLHVSLHADGASPRLYNQFQPRPSTAPSPFSSRQCSTSQNVPNTQILYTATHPCVGQRAAPSIPPPPPRSTWLSPPRRRTPPPASCTRTSQILEQLRRVSELV